MPDWKKGWRELSDDLQRIGVWITFVSAVIAVVLAGVWFWWSYLWDVPPPVRALQALAAFVLWWVIVYGAALIGHKYFGVPAGHPGRLLSKPPASGVAAIAGGKPDAEGNVEQSGRWLTERERNEEAKASRAEERIPPIPEGEFLLSTKEKNGSTFIRVRNVKEEAKTGFVMRVRDVQLWSDVLANGKGGFGRWGPFVALQRHLDLVGGLKKGTALHFHDPTFFDLVRNPQAGPWMLNGANGDVPLRDGRWRFIVELHWNGGVLEEQYDVRLTTTRSGKLAEYLTFEPTPAASPSAASAPGSADASSRGTPHTDGSKNA